MKRMTLVANRKPRYRRTTWLWATANFASAIFYDPHGNYVGRVRFMFRKGEEQKVRYTAQQMCEIGAVGVLSPGEAMRIIHLDYPATLHPADSFSITI